MHGNLPDYMACSPHISPQVRFPERYITFKVEGGTAQRDKWVAALQRAKAEQGEREAGAAQQKVEGTAGLEYLEKMKKVRRCCRCALIIPAFTVIMALPLHGDRGLLSCGCEPPPNPQNAHKSCGCEPPVVRL